MGRFVERARLLLRAPFKFAQAIDINILNAAKNAVQAGRVAAGAVPVPGLPIALEALNAILEKAEKAQSNKEGLEALCIEIQNASKGITTIVENVKPKVECYPAGTSVRTALQDSGRKEYTDLSRRISEFESQLKAVEKEADVLIGRSWWRRWVAASEDATTLNNMTKKVAQAYQKFQIHGQISMEQMLTQVVDQIIEAESNQLLDKLAPGANPTFRADSNARKAQFLPGTRAGIMKRLAEWAHETPGELQSMHALIVEGGGGMGKSTIASEFCRQLEKHGRLGASFFFTRGTPELESAAAVIPHVAKQLAQASEHLRPAITEAAKTHLKKGGQQQVKYAFADLLDPLRSVKSPSPMYIVIDALDECREDPQVPGLSELCRSLLAFVTESSSFRLLLTTRPIPDSPLREAIDQFKSSAQLYTISLHDDLAKASIDEDIAELFRAVLSTDARAQQRCAEDDTIVPRLVKRADGLFVYARTAATFLTIESGGSFDEALEFLLSKSSDAPHAKLNDLNKLYATVLTTAFPPEQQLPPKERVRSILAWLIIGFSYVPSGWVQYRSGIPPEQSVSILEKLLPVLTVNDEDIPVERREFRIMHDTFREFVTSNELRAGNNFHISIAEAYTVVAIGLMKLLCAAVEPEGEGWAMDGWDWGRVWAARFAYENWEENVSRSRDGGFVSEGRDALAERVGSFLGTESQCDAFYARWEKCYFAL